MWKDILYTYLVGSTTQGRSPFGGLYLVRERLLTTMTGDRVRLRPGEKHRVHRRETEQRKLHHMGLPIENQHIWSINPSTRAHLKMGQVMGLVPNSSTECLEVEKMSQVPQAWGAPFGQKSAYYHIRCGERRSAQALHYLPEFYLLVPKTWDETGSTQRLQNLGKVLGVFG